MLGGGVLEEGLLGLGLLGAGRRCRGDCSIAACWGVIGQVANRFIDPALDTTHSSEDVREAGYTPRVDSYLDVFAVSQLKNIYYIQCSNTDLVPSYP